MLESIQEDYLKWELFSYEATFHVSGHVNCLHVQIWGTKNTHVICEDVHNSPKLSMWCTIGWQTHIAFMRKLSHGVSDISHVWSQSWKNSNCFSFSNRMACHLTGVTMCGHFLIKDFLADGMAVVDQSPVSHAPLVSWLGFFPVAVCEGLCLQNICGWHWKVSYRIFQTFWSVCRNGLLDWCNQGQFPCQGEGVMETNFLS